MATESLIIISRYQVVSDTRKDIVSRLISGRYDPIDSTTEEEYPIILNSSYDRIAIIEESEDKPLETKVRDYIQKEFPGYNPKIISSFPPKDIPSLLKKLRKDGNC
tara:strand:- start:10 stop:327 length:318 start_codon:yes stop_codon:yes gene_type:complete